MKTTALQEWYEKQSVRDQRVLVTGGVIIVVMLLGWLTLLPYQAVERAKKRVEEQQQLLAYMRQVGPVLSAAGAGGAVQPINESFVVFIDRTAREHGLAGAITGTPAAGSGAFRVNLENGDFNLLLTWLHQLATRYAVQVESATVNGSGAPGKVSGSVQLRPPA
jgi:general secretion pathway protein M